MSSAFGTVQFTRRSLGHYGREHLLVAAATAGRGRRPGWGAGGGGFGAGQSPGGVHRTARRHRLRGPSAARLLGRPGNRTRGPTCGAGRVPRAFRAGRSDLPARGDRGRARRGNGSGDGVRGGWALLRISRGHRRHPTRDRARQRRRPPPWIRARRRAVDPHRGTPGHRGGVPVRRKGGRGGHHPAGGRGVARPGGGSAFGRFRALSGAGRDTGGVPADQRPAAGRRNRRARASRRRRAAGKCPADPRFGPRRRRFRRTDGRAGGRSRRGLVPRRPGPRPDGGGGGRFRAGEPKPGAGGRRGGGGARRRGQARRGRRAGPHLSGDLDPRRGSRDPVLARQRAAGGVAPGSGARGAGTAPRAVAGRRSGSQSGGSARTLVPRLGGAGPLPIRKRPASWQERRSPKTVSSWIRPWLRNSRG